MSDRAGSRSVQLPSINTKAMIGGTYSCIRHIPAEADLPVIEAQQPMIANGHPMGTARQVMQDVFRTAERRFVARRERSWATP